MEALLKAISDALAALFRAIGYVGATRRRVGIREDLDLLHRLKAEDSNHFGPDTWIYQVLVGHIMFEVGKLAGLKYPTRWRQVNWGSFVMGIAGGGGLAYWTYTLNSGGFEWYSIFVGILAALLLIGGFGQLNPQQQAPEQPESDEEPSSNAR